MHSTEAEMASDYPFFRAVRQLFGKKRHPGSGNRPFHPLIGDLAPFACPEMTTFGNAAERSYCCRCAGGLPGDSWTGMPFCDPGPGPGCFPGMQSSEVILASDYPYFGAVRQLFGKKRHPGSGNRPFQSLIGSLAPFTCPEMTTFGNVAGQDIGIDGLGAVSRRGMKEPLWQRFRGYLAGGTVPDYQPVTAAGPAGKIRRKMYRRRMCELVEEMNPL
jgi:hypothetical protein